MTLIDWGGVIASIPPAIVAIVAIVYSNIGNRRLQNTTILLDFSKRYQEIMLAMPDEENKQEKYILLYFDLCSEEYRLRKKSKSKRRNVFHRVFNWRDELVDIDTWKLWEDGMKIFMTTKAKSRQIWKENRMDYDSDDFQCFFDEIVAKAESER